MFCQIDFVPPAPSSIRFNSQFRNETSLIRAISSNVRRLGKLLPNKSLLSFIYDNISCEMIVTCLRFIYRITQQVQLQLTVKNKTTTETKKGTLLSRLICHCEIRRHGGLNPCCQRPEGTAFFLRREPLIFLSFPQNDLVIFTRHLLHFVE